MFSSISRTTPAAGVFPWLEDFEPAPASFIRSNRYECQAFYSNGSTPPLSAGRRPARRTSLSVLALLTSLMFGSVGAQDLYGDDSNGVLSLDSSHSGLYGKVVGWNSKPDASGASVSVENAEVKLSFSGTYEGYIYGARYEALSTPYPQEITLSGNNVKVVDSSASLMAGAYANANDKTDKTSLESNTLTLEGKISSVNNSIALYGANITRTKKALASGNAVFIHNADLNLENQLMAIGALINIKTVPDEAVSSNNKVEVVGSSINAYWGGLIGADINGKSREIAIGNSVLIDSSQIKTQLPSHFIVAGARVDIDGSEDEASATGNYVELRNAEVHGSVFGAFNLKTNSGIDSGNYIAASGVNSAQSIGGFDTLKLKVGEENRTDAVLTLSSSIDFTDRKIEVSPSDGFVWDGKDSFVLITAEEIKGVSDEGVVLSDLWIDYNASVDVSTSGDQKQNLILSSFSPSSNENSKTLAQSYLGSLALVAQGAEFIADRGLAAAYSASSHTYAPAVFGAVHGGSSRYETGSHVDLDGVSLAAGSAVRSNETVYAGFIEAGWGSSESRAGTARGDGDHEYFGLGAALRRDFSSDVHVDAAVRAGWIRTEFSGVYNKSSAGYDSSAFYMSAHIGAGVAIPLNKDYSADFYARYSITYIDSDDVDVHDEDQSRLHLDSSTAHAVRIGVLTSGSLTKSTSWRGGLAYEHVFGGDADSRVNGVDLLSPTIEGNTGIIEFGLATLLDPTSGWTCDLDLKGYVGDRQGISAGASLSYNF